MSEKLHDALKVALDLLESEGLEDEAYEISSAIRMFAPHKGDPKEEATQRKILSATCGNCDMTWPGMAMPALLEDAATTAMRFAKCPRCFATENIHVKS